MRPESRELNRRINYISTVVVSFALFSLAIVPFQNCGRSFETLPMSNATDLSSLGDSPLVPPTDQLDPNCMTSSAYDACIFLKNPVAHSDLAFNGLVNSEALASRQTYGVKLTGLSKSGRLENSTFFIETLTGQPVNTFNLTKAGAFPDPEKRSQQLMAYYWLNRATEYIAGRTKTFPAYGKGIRVVIDDTLAGWSSRSGSIHLKIPENGNAMAWSAELAIHYLGLANLHYATGGNIMSLESSAAIANHQDCNLKPAGCCTKSLGCARAIASGVGDYFAAMVFPMKPVLGEAWGNDVQGMKACSLNRNLNTAVTRTASSSFSACTSYGMPGEIHTMGSLYASIWWEVRKSAGPDREAEIDTLFMKHLEKLNADDDFRSAIQKAKSLDIALYGGSYSSLFDAQLTSRGL